MRVQIASSRPLGKQVIEIAKRLAKKQNIKFVDDKPDLFISVLYDKLIKKDFIQSVNLGCYNFHPGYLPNFKGCGACSWAIIEGCKMGGVTLHKIDEGIDSGDIIDYKLFKIDETDTGYNVWQKSNQAILDLFEQYFVRIIKENVNLKAKKQDLKIGKVYSREMFREALNLTKRPVQEWPLYIRAFYFPHKELPYVEINNQRYYLSI
jgi:methionyl-tRNA formyltransferase